MSMESFGVSVSRTPLSFIHLSQDWRSVSHAESPSAILMSARAAQNVAMVALAWSVVAFHSWNKFESSFANSSTASAGKTVCCLWFCTSRH